MTSDPASPAPDGKRVDSEPCEHEWIHMGKVWECNGIGDLYGTVLSIDSAVSVGDAYHCRKCHAETVVPAIPTGKRP